MEKTSSEQAQSKSSASVSSRVGLGATLVALAGVGQVGYGIMFLIRTFTGFIELGLTPEHVGSLPEQKLCFSPIPACNEVGPGSLAQSNTYLTVSPIFSGSLLSKHPHVPSMTGGATSLQCAVVLKNTTFGGWAAPSYGGIMSPLG